MKERILVIKLGALGDLVLCASAFAAIRAHHPDAEIAILTGKPFAAFALAMPWFDKVLIDPRPKITEPLKWIRLIRDVRSFAPTRVYDFQGKKRQAILYYVLGRPHWSGAVKGCSHPRPWPPVKGQHYTDFVAAQLEAAGVPTKDFSSTFQNRHSGAVSCCCERPQDLSGMTKSASLSWLDGDLAAFNLPEKFAIIVTGCSPQHPHKMWPASHYAALADRFKEKGMAVIAIGTKADAPSVEAVRALAPHVIDLTGQTSLGQVAALARRAEIVVGNDTGPTHIAAAVGAKTVALMSEKVDPLWSSPRGPKATWVGGKSLQTVAVAEVMACF